MRQAAEEAAYMGEILEWEHRVRAAAEEQRKIAEEWTRANTHRHSQEDSAKPGLVATDNHLFAQGPARQKREAEDAEIYI